MLKAIILEDEINGLENLKNLLSLNCPHVEVVGEGGSIKEGYELLKKPDSQPDIVFLDINLPDGLVFRLLDQEAVCSAVQTKKDSESQMKTSNDILDFGQQRKRVVIVVGSLW